MFYISSLPQIKTLGNCKKSVNEGKGQSVERSLQSFESMNICAVSYRLYLDLDYDSEGNLHNVLGQSKAPPSSECFRMLFVLYRV